MRKLIVVGLVLCILLTVLVSGASAAPKEDKVIRGTVSVSNYVYATASSVDKPSSASAVAYTQAEILKNGMAALGVTQASASGNSAYVYSEQTLSGYFTSK